MGRSAVMLAVAALCLSACADPYHGIYNRTPTDFPSVQTRRFDATDHAAVVAAAKQSLEGMGYTVSSEAGSLGVLVAWQMNPPETPEAGVWKSADWSAYQAKEYTEVVNEQLAQLFYALPQNNPPPQQYSKNKFWNSVLNDLAKPSPPRIDVPGRPDDERAAVMVSVPSAKQIDVRAWFDRMAGREGSASYVYSRDFEPMLYTAFYRGMEQALSSKAGAR